MPHRHAPERRSVRKLRRQRAERSTLAIRDPEARVQRGIGAGRRVDVEVGEAARPAGDLDDDARRFGNPCALRAVVASERYRLAIRVAREVRHVAHHILIELRGRDARRGRRRDAELDGVRVTTRRRQIAGHPVLAAAARELGDLDEAWRPIRIPKVRDVRRGWKEHHRLPRRIGIGARLGLETAHRLPLCGARGETIRGMRVGDGQDDLGRDGRPLVLRQHRALNRQVPRALVIEGERAAAVHHEVEPAVGANPGPPELRMIQDAHRSAERRARAVVAHHAAANHGGVLLLDRARSNAGLDGVCSRVEEADGVREARSRVRGPGRHHQQRRSRGQGTVERDAIDALRGRRVAPGRAGETHEHARRKHHVRRKHRGAVERNADLAGRERDLHRVRSLE